MFSRKLCPAQDTIASKETPARSWSNPSGTVVGNPFQIAPGTYMQFTQPSPPASTLNITTNTGASWAAVGTIPQSLSGRPWIAGPPGNPTIYQGIQKPGGIDFNALRHTLRRWMNRRPRASQGRRVYEWLSWLSPHSVPHQPTDTLPVPKVSKIATMQPS